MTSSPEKSKSFCTTIRYTCEPVLFLYAFGSMLQYPTIHQYTYSIFAKREGFHYSYVERTQECQQGTMNSTQMELQEQVQFLTARFSVIYQLGTAVPSAIMCLFYGALSDIVGRRCIIIVVLLGAFIESLLILATMFFNFPLLVISFGNICAGLGGGFNGLFMCIIAYTADITTTKDRSVRIGIIESCLFFGMTLSNFVSGPLIHNFGFACPELIVVMCHSFALLYTALILKESRAKEDTDGEEQRPVYYIFHQQPRNMWRVLVKDRPNRCLLYLAIIILVSGLAFVVSTQPAFTLYLLNRPFCLPALEVGYIMGYYFLMLAIGTAFGMKVLLNVFPECFLSLVSFILSSGSYFLLSFSMTKAHLYGAVTLRIFGGLPSAIFRGRISQSVDENEQGAIFSLVTSIEMLMIFFGVVIFNFSYAKLNNLGHPGWFFNFPALLIFIPVILLIIYWIKSYNVSAASLTDEKEDFTEKEKLLDDTEAEEDVM